MYRLVPIFALLILAGGLQAADDDLKICYKTKKSCGVGISTDQGVNIFGKYYKSKCDKRTGRASIKTRDHRKKKGVYPGSKGCGDLFIKYRKPDGSYPEQWTQDPNGCYHPVVGADCPEI